MDDHEKIRDRRVIVAIADRATVAGVPIVEFLRDEITRTQTEHIQYLESELRMNRTDQSRAGRRMSALAEIVGLIVGTSATATKAIEEIQKRADIVMKADF